MSKKSLLLEKASVEDKDIPDGGGGCQPQGDYFTENFMIMKKIWPGEGKKSL